ncbi:MAG: PIG-L family deacetylase [Terracidiphilus sp.]
MSAALAGLIVAGASPFYLDAQQSASSAFNLPAARPSSIALPLPEDRGEAALEQTLKRLGTTASVLMIVAHPDDEDGGLLTYLSRGLGVRATLFTLTRGEGGQNAMSAEADDALGIMRTNELLKADEYYGARQMWGTEADFGFSKTQEEAFARWGHERVLYDAVLAVRRARPQIIVATFSGGVSDGHGQHQVSGEIAQEVFKAAGDPKVFPDQIKAGYQPWQPLAVYSMVPFAPITDKGMFDYATGKWAPARFHNYVTGEWISGAPSTDVTLQVGTRDASLGRSYQQIAREGWGMQKSQNGGANPTLSGPGTARYHLWAVAPSAKTPANAAAKEDDLFHNRLVNVDTGLAGLAQLAPSAPAWLTRDLSKLDAGIREFERTHAEATGMGSADELAPLYRQALALRSEVATSNLDSQARASLLFELDAKIGEFQTALANLLGLDLMAFRTNETHPDGGGFRGNTADETPRSVAPGEAFRVRVHTMQSTSETRLEKVWLESASGSPWQSKMTGGAVGTATQVSDPIFTVQTPEDAVPTAPFFTRPSVEQPYYDVSPAALRGDSFAPYPLAAWAQFDFQGLPIRIGQVVQTLERVTGPGGIYEPLVVTPAIGVRIEQDARILPLDGSALPVRVTVHTEGAADGTVSLKLPDGWQCEPASAQFHRATAGDTEPITFRVTPGPVKTGAYSMQAVAQSAGHTYETGWQSVGYAGLRPYNQYKPAELRTRKIDVALAPGLRVGYIMGTGDRVPEAIEGLGLSVHTISNAELASADLSAWNVIVVGIRAYSVRPELAAAQARLNEFVRNGGTLIVQYQSSNFPAPFPLTLGRIPERVVDEQAPVKLLVPHDPLLTWPNHITAADFDGWVEERGHSFLDTWDPACTALTETADPGQDPQRGGLLVAHPGKGTYVYAAYALYRQLPELVPGSYRILANLLSAGQADRKLQ